MSGTRPDDRELEEFLQGRSEISAAYRELDGEEPPEHLDEALGAAARRETGTRPRRLGAPFSGHWTVPASLAAVLVLSVTVVRLMPETERPAVEPAASPEALRDERDAAAPIRGGRKNEALEQPTAGPEKQAPAGIGSEMEMSDPPATLRFRITAPKDEAPAATGEDRGRLGRSLETPEARLRGSDPPRSGKSSVFEQERARQSAPAEERMAPMAPAPPASVAPERKRSATESPPATPPGLPATEGTPVGEAEPAARRAREAHSEATGTAGTLQARRPAEAWLAAIESLLGAGRVEAARRELVDFLRVYPDHPLEGAVADLAAELR